MTNKGLTALSAQQTVIPDPTLSPCNQCVSVHSQLHPALKRQQQAHIITIPVV